MNSSWHENISTWHDELIPDKTHIVISLLSCSGSCVQAALHCRGVSSVITVWHVTMSQTWAHIWSRDHCPVSPLSLSEASSFSFLQSSRLRSQISILSLHTIWIECYILFRLSYLVRFPLYFMIKFWDFATKFWLALLHKFLNGHLQFAWVGWRPGLTALAAIFANIKQIWDPEIKWTKNGHNYKQ